MKRIIWPILVLLLAACSSWHPVPTLQTELQALVDSMPGKIGIAYVADDDTVVVANDATYPMMSVFKLHQALALARADVDPDSLLAVSAAEIDPDTWSPMLKVYGHGDFSATVSQLVRYAVTASDNNASNILFRRILSPGSTDSIVRSFAADTSFAIVCTEAEMKCDHLLSALNRTSPLAAALLIRQAMEEPVANSALLDSIRLCLREVTTGHDRLGIVVDQPDVALFAHKTGSGYRDAQGLLMAHNDAGYFRLSDGRAYALAVFITAFSGTEQEASQIIAAISRQVHAHQQARRQAGL